jgi:hypothetical protein
MADIEDIRRRNDERRAQAARLRMRGLDDGGVDSLFIEQLEEVANDVDVLLALIEDD